MNEIPAPRPVTVKVQRLSVETLAECDRVLARKAARERAEFEAHADLDASLEFGDTKEATIL
jgi:hypothetical protein